MIEIGNEFDQLPMLKKVLERKKDKLQTLIELYEFRTIDNTLAHIISDTIDIWLEVYARIKKIEEEARSDVRNR